MVKVTLIVEDMDKRNGRGTFDTTIQTGEATLYDPTYFIDVVSRRVAVRLSEEMHVGPEAEEYRERKEAEASYIDTQF
jgi:hypothetical protein